MYVSHETYTSMIVDIYDEYYKWETKSSHLEIWVQDSSKLLERPLVLGILLHCEKEKSLLKKSSRLWYLFILCITITTIMLPYHYT